MKTSHPPRIPIRTLLKLGVLAATVIPAFAFSTAFAQDTGNKKSKDATDAKSAEERAKANLANKGLGVAEATKAGLKPHPHTLEDVLIYSKSAWYVHATLSATNHWFFHFGLDNGVNIDQTDDPTKFNLDDLSRYQVLILNSTTNFGEDLNQEQREALITWFRQGHGIVAIHAAAVSHHVWDWYTDLVGCDFVADSDRAVARLVVDPAAIDNPAVKRYAPEFQLNEEWLCFDHTVTGQPNVNVLLRVDESTYDPVRAKFREMNVKPMGADHPVAWTRETQGGRFFYTAIGHDARALNTDFGRHHILEALRWAAFETK
ncbi:MAG: ThuA domain-containing protein [Chthoniobacter sp.]|nr:ThuA domain-containing protein [Chthoniobacter sp.]